MSKFPYAGLPKRQVWKRSVTDVAPAEIDPQMPGRFAFTPATRIASAGSCFAERITGALQSAHYSYLVTEAGPPERGFGRYSARYGEIYTALQLAQLAQRCIGAFVPQEPAWMANGRFHDPFRPRVEPGGFASLDDLESDRAHHLAATRRALTESDVFIFTLGLTEAWCSRVDGAVFPLCPGAGIGTFDDARHTFANLTVDDTVAALQTFLDIATSLNPRLRVILTISPVPLAATFEPRHVIASTVYSKAVLRVAAETIRARHTNVDYFAAYEIVTGVHDGQDNFGPDRRDVRSTAVERVMRSFFKAFSSQPTLPELASVPATVDLPAFELSLDAISATPPPPRSPHDPCDENYLAGFIAKGATA